MRGSSSVNLPRSAVDREIILGEAAPGRNATYQMPLLIEFRSIVTFHRKAAHSVRSSRHAELFAI